MNINHNTLISYHNWLTIMLVKLVDQSTHPVVPQLDDSVVQTCKNPWPLGMET